MSATSDGRTEIPVTPSAPAPSAPAPSAPAAATSATVTSAPAATSGRVEEASFFVAVGGEPTFRRLVHRFYDGVATDPLLRPMYPEEDLAPAADRLTLFLMQYWGGPNTYSASRGHPRLRLRHAPFEVTPAARDAWLRHMKDAVDSLGLPEPHHSALWDYLERAAHFMVNSA